MNNHQPSCTCNCFHRLRSPHQAPPGFTRRDFLYGVGALTIGSIAAHAAQIPGSGAVSGLQSGPLARIPLRVQPVLSYEIPQRRQATSWRNWGGIQTEEDAAREKEKIGRELDRLRSQAGFPLEVRPLTAVRTVPQASELAGKDHDVLLLYAAGGGVNILEALTAPGKWNLMFLRHDPGPVYLWYEIAHPRFLRKTVDDYGQPGMGRARCDGRRSVGDPLAPAGAERPEEHAVQKNRGDWRPGGWGTGGKNRARGARELWRMELIRLPLQGPRARFRKARQNTALVKRCRGEAIILQAGGVSLETTREFLDNAFHPDRSLPGRDGRGPDRRHHHQLLHEHDHAASPKPRPACR